MFNRPVKGNSDSSWRDPNLREGFTTGSCAAAAAAAATRALLTGQPVTAITIDLPVRKNVTFAVNRCEIKAGRVICGVIKDAGDDPDVTNGAEIQAAVSWNDQIGEIILARGEGVGLVTRPGLPIDVDEPAINPVPRKMIRRSVLRQAGMALDKHGLTITISVPGGEEIAKETLNPRLGIMGGISILGTTGIVKPFSTSAYRASVYIELKVAAQNHAPAAVLTTGSRSEQYAMDRYPDWLELAFIQVGDHIDYGLKQARRLKFERVVISGMIGKISKLAQGRMQTHVSLGEVDFDFLAEVAGQLGADDDLIGQIREANTAHHVQSMLDKAGVSGIESRLAQMAADQTAKFIGGAFDIEVLVWDMKGNLLASHEERIMTQRIVVIGVGGAGPDSLCPAVLAQIEQADQLWGGKRLLAYWPDHPGEQMVIGANIPKLLERLTLFRDQKIVILASGDPGFYGIGGTLLRHLPPEEVEIMPHISSLQTAFAKAGIAWSDAIMTSAHARPLAEIVGWARRAPKLGILTDQKHTPALIAQTLLDAGLPDCQAIVAERLGLPDEELTNTRLVDLPGMSFDDLNVLLLVQDEDWRPQATFSPRPEEAYAHRRGLITKQDVRALSLMRLALRETDVAWDIGAGSGSVSIEIAELAWRGTVYAIEHDKKNISFIEKNIGQYGVLNVKLIKGRAPDALERLLAPDAVFIGGTGGKMEAILKKVQQEARPGCRVVINLATLENLNNALRITKSLGWATQVTQVNIAQGKAIARQTRLDPLNPVFIVSAVLEG